MTSIWKQSKEKEALHPILIPNIEYKKTMSRSYHFAQEIKSLQPKDQFRNRITLKIFDGTDIKNQPILPDDNFKADNIQQWLYTTVIGRVPYIFYYLSSEGNNSMNIAFQCIKSMQRNAEVGNDLTEVMRRSLAYCNDKIEAIQLAQAIEKGINYKNSITVINSLFTS